MTQTRYEDLKTKADRELGYGTRFKGLISRCLLVSMTFSRWRGSYQIDKAETLAEGKKLPKDITTPGRWRLIPEEFSKKLNHIESRARHLMTAYVVPFSLPGVYIVPIESAEELFSQLRQIKADLQAEADSFCSPENYKNIMKYVWEKCEGDAEVFRAVKSVLPSRNKIKDKFGIRWSLVPMGTPNEDFSDNPSEFIREAQEQTKLMVQEAVDNMLREPRAELAAALDNLANIMEKAQASGARGSVKQASIDNARAALKKLKSFDFIADDSLLKQLEVLDSSLSTSTPKELNSGSDSAKALAKSLRSLSEQTQDDDRSIAKFDRFSRNLDFED